jgi:hypothetical protein
MVNVLTHSPEAGSFQFSHKAASVNGCPSFIAITEGRFFLPTFLHSGSILGRWLPLRPI